MPVNIKLLVDICMLLWFVALKRSRFENRATIISISWLERRSIVEFQALQWHTLLIVTFRLIPSIHGLYFDLFEYFNFIVIAVRVPHRSLLSYDHCTV